MRLSPAVFWGVLLAFAGIFAGAVMTTFPTHVFIGYTVMLLSSLAIIGLVTNQIWPEHTLSLTGRVPFLKNITASEFLPLREAALLVLERYPDSVPVEFARRHGADDPSGEETLEWLGYWIATKGVTIYGRRTPSRIMQEIPADRVAMGGLTDASARFVRDGLDSYEGLAVKRSEFRQRFESLKG